MRANKFLAQTIGPRDPANIRLGESVFLILGGLFKKVIIANYLSTDFVDGVFRDPTAIFEPRSHASACMPTRWQIYCDFSAYTDIAIGVANLLGYEFPQNFNQPYRAHLGAGFLAALAHDAVELAARLSLHPARRQHVGTFATYRNIMITMALGGLWHGASWAFVIWGCLHGAALVIERMLGVTGDHDADKRGTFATALGWLVTTQFVCLAWVFFRAPSTDAWLGYFATMLSGRNWSTSVTPFVAVIFALGALSHILPPRMFVTLEKRYDAASLSVKVLVPFVVIYLISVAAPAGIAPFIYFQF